MNCVKQLNEPYIAAPAFRRVYTSYTLVDEILNRYHDKLKGGGIILRVKGDEISRCVLNDSQIREILTESLAMAEEAVTGCRWSYMRYVQLDNMVAQKKQFLKITYPCENIQNIQNIHYQNLSGILKKKNGYIRMESKEDENVLMIAVGTKC
ncbi:MAG: hypothetical protein PHQ72_06610 [Hespellia sp.]|nr:hypothetical protein [Hespellia sp.]